MQEHWGTIHNLGIIEGYQQPGSTAAETQLPFFNRTHWETGLPPESLKYYDRHFSTLYKRCGNGKVTAVHPSVGFILFDRDDPIATIRAWFSRRSQWRDERFGSFLSSNVSGMEFITARGLVSRFGRCEGGYQSVSLACSAGERITEFEFQYLMPKYLEDNRALRPTVEAYVGGPLDDHPSLLLSFTVSTPAAACVEKSRPNGSFFKMQTLTNRNKVYKFDGVDRSEASCWWICTRNMRPRPCDTLAGLQVTVGEELTGAFGLICKGRE